jgi:hypothetical protein
MSKEMSLGEILNLVRDCFEKPRNEMLLREDAGNYFLNGVPLPADHPEEWGRIIIARMAKGYLRDG